MGITQLGYLGLGVSDLSRWETFATEILGLSVSERLDDGGLYLRMDDYHHRFILHPDDADDVLYVGWQVPTAGDLDELEAALQAKGVRTERGTSDELNIRRVVDLIKFEDPARAHLEAFYGPQVQPASPLSSDRADGSFNAGDLGLGHIVLAVSDLDKAVAFYRDALGMRISDLMELGAGEQKFHIAFFHCNPRHHSIAFIQLESPRRLSHMMLEVKSLDDVGATYYMCQDQEIPIALSLGKHTNDHMVSFYVVTPSGFQVEYGFGGRHIDDTTWVVQRHISASLWGHRNYLRKKGGQRASPPRRGDGHGKSRG